ncbi:uncharacterized protein LOC126653751 [Mercurialis annua]|uniref:uncharacterized protein LOC126653751 n=1 Tax=Mercurialis annua TaxID=3986 RepID=UPI00216002C0|nr:uncharacterized protein LOC126653751 [Mercurialis annua]
MVNKVSSMEECDVRLGQCHFDNGGTAVKRKRTQTSRRPKPDSQPASLDHSPSSTTPPSDEFDSSSGRQEFNINACTSRVSSATVAAHEKNHLKRNESGRFCSNESGRSTNGSRRFSEGVLAPANRKNTSKLKDFCDSESVNATNCPGKNGERKNLEQPEVLLDALVNENKVKKVKLKVGGITRTIHSNLTANGSTQNSQLSETSRVKHKPQENLDENHAVLKNKIALRGVPWKDFSTGSFCLGKESTFMGKVSGKNASGKQGEKSETVRKSKRPLKRRLLDEEIGEDSEDDEIRYLEKLKNPKFTGGFKDDEESSRKQRRLSSMSDIGASKLVKDGKKNSSDRASEEIDVEEEDLGSEGELEGNKKKQKKESVEALMDDKREMTLTTRQRALQSSRDGSASGANLIEFPNGLPPAPSRKQKEKLTETEQQLRKAEAAQKRRIQVENAARVSQAEAIKKILCQESSRKKREEKNKKRLEEIAQERAANALTLPPNTIRCVTGATGTVVTFSNDMGLPSLFSKPCSYPPPRENCAGPSCTNPYKYRDSKSKLPLCSLQCYKAVQEQTKAEASC